MFTWICPQCGREVPPAYTECPDCSKKAAPADPQATPPPEPQPQSPPPVQVHPYQPPPPAAPRGGLPTWLLTILFTFAFFGLVAGIYWLLSTARGPNAKPAAVVESPAAKPNAKTSPYQKYVEVSGVRFLENAKKKTEVRFIVTNHSNADLIGLGGNVTVWGRTRNSEEDAAGSFTFSSDLKGYESKELTAPFNTKLKVYELPDWQNVSADVQITAPASQ